MLAQGAGLADLGVRTEATWGISIGLSAQNLVEAETASKLGRRISGFFLDGYGKAAQ